MTLVKGRPHGDIFGKETNVGPIYMDNSPLRQFIEHLIMCENAAL